MAKSKSQLKREKRKANGKKEEKAQNLAILHQHQAVVDEDSDDDVIVITETPADLPPELLEVHQRFIEQATTSKYVPSASDGDGESGGHIGDGTDGAAAAVSGSLGTAAQSGKQARQSRAFTTAKLKLVVERPDLVETHDANSRDPLFLLHLKAYRNTVAVPTHWQQKRRFLAKRRGLDLQTKYQLPNDVAATGVATIRRYYVEKAAAKATPGTKGPSSTGRIDVEYDKLQECFLHQTRPRMTSFGETYYEGREYEIRCKDARPGLVSARLRKALGMPTDESPPPWLPNMQTHGPPPSYPSLKLPGVNAPIPKGAQWGFGRGQWGKPPTDALGNGLFGDIHGLKTSAEDPSLRVLWGALRDDDDSSSDGEREVAAAAAPAPLSKPTTAVVPPPPSATTNVMQSIFQAPATLPDVVTPSGSSASAAGQTFSTIVPMGGSGVPPVAAAGKAVGMAAPGPKRPPVAIGKGKRGPSDALKKTASTVRF
eukprot:PhM_4_TR1400/c0_g1_i1/m.70326/K12829/SF3B2, SAP145, CUS1; splicing factor 3B subunit 2